MLDLQEARRNYVDISDDGNEQENEADGNSGGGSDGDDDDAYVHSIDLLLVPVLAKIFIPEE